MFTCKIKTGAEWNLPKHPREIDKRKSSLSYSTKVYKGKKMDDIKAIKEILKSLQGQYKTITQEEDGEYIVIKAS